MKDVIFPFHLKWVDSLSAYPPDTQLDIFNGIIHYVKTGTMPERMKSHTRMALSFICHDIDRDKQIEEEKFKRRSEASRATALKRWHRAEPLPIDKPRTTDADSDKYLVCPEMNATQFVTMFFHESRLMYISALATEYHISMDEFRSKAELILGEWKITDEYHTSFNDAARHLVSTIRIKADKENKQTYKQQRTGIKTDHAQVNKGWDNIEMPTLVWNPNKITNKQ